MYNEYYLQTTDRVSPFFEQQRRDATGSSYFLPMKHLPMKKNSSDETLSANERLSETSQNLSLAITLSLAVAKTVGMLNCSPNSLHSANERF